MPAKLTIWECADSHGNIRLLDLAREAGVDPRTARKWVEAELVRYRRLPRSGRILIKAVDAERFLASLEHGPA